MRVADDIGGRHPAGERHGRMSRGQAAPERSPASGPRLGGDDDDHGQHQGDQADLGGCVANPVEDVGGLVRCLAREDEIADGDGVDGRDQHGPGRNVLRQLGHRIE